MTEPTSAAAGRRLARYGPACLLAVVLVLSQPCLAAVDLQSGEATEGQPAAGGVGGVAATHAASAGAAARRPLWQLYESMYPSDRLIPVVTTMRGHEVAYQIPENPTALLFIAPGCSHAAHDWWPASEACPQCLGLPEEVAHTQQALARGYAVLVMSSKNAHGDMCMDWKSNHRDAERIIDDLRRQHAALGGLPLYGLGVSVGGGFVAKLAARVAMAGVVSEVLGPEPEPWDLDKYKFGLPPIVFVSMDQDPAMAARISADAARLRTRGGVVATVRVAPRVVGPGFFSDRSSHVAPDTSARVVAALHQIGMLDERGYVTVDPRHTKRPWVKQLLALVPELDGGMTEDHSHVWEEMNLAYSSHEIIADFATAAFAWLESGGKADFAQLVGEHGAPGHTGLVADAAGAIPPPAAAAPPAPQGARRAPPEAAPAQQVYAVHEAAVRAAEADWQQTAAEERLPAESGDSTALPKDLQGQTDQQEDRRQPQAGVGLPGGQPGDAARRVAMRMQNATGPRLELQPLQSPHTQHGEGSGATSSLQHGGGAQAPEQPQHGGAAAPASLDEGDRQAAAGSGFPSAAAPAPTPAAAVAAAAPAAANAARHGVTPAALLGGIGCAAAGAALVFALHRFVGQPWGFDALPFNEPRGQNGLPFKPPPELPISSGARLPPIPETPDALARV